MGIEREARSIRVIFMGTGRKFPSLSIRGVKCLHRRRVTASFPPLARHSIFPSLRYMTVIQRLRIIETTDNCERRRLSRIKMFRDSSAEDITRTHTCTNTSARVHTHAHAPTRTRFHKEFRTVFFFFEISK